MDTAKITSENYVTAVLRTEALSPEIGARLSTQQNQRLLHGAMGLCTEAGELMDTVKKHVFYGKPIDTVNIVEELGDLGWYFAVICAVLGVSMNEVLTTNIAKLQTRYPEKFTEEAALVRDLDKERGILDNTDFGNYLKPFKFAKRRKPPTLVVGMNAPTKRKVNFFRF